MVSYYICLIANQHDNMMFIANSIHQTSNTKNNSLTQTTQKWCTRNTYHSKNVTKELHYLHAHLKKFQWIGTLNTLWWMSFVMKRFISVALTSTKCNCLQKSIHHVTNTLVVLMPMQHILSMHFVLHTICICHCFNVIAQMLQLKCFWW